MQIIGAGLSGLIAAHIWPRAPVYEVAPAPSPTHAALLRFRSEAVSNIVGIPFRRVTVRKGIWHDGAYHTPSIRLSNLYSQKCLSRIEPDRSIWNIEPAERYVAPSDLYQMLVDAVGLRITWGCDFYKDVMPTLSSTAPKISTAPLPTTLSALGYPHPAEFRRAAITVQRYLIPKCDAFQTVYFPSSKHSMYRASITGQLLIVEHATAEAPQGYWDESLEAAFGIDLGAATPLSTVRQEYGKIAPIPDTQRKATLFELTRLHRIFSLGRFACWRNSLLDDVVADAAVIKRLALYNFSDYEGFKS